MSIGIAIVLATALSIAVFIALLDLLFIISWRVIPLHASAPLAAMGARSARLRSWRHLAASLIGWRLASAPSANIRRRVAELFPLKLLLDPRPDARWQVWYNAHIPAFIARAAPARSNSRVIAAIFDGFTDATRALAGARTSGVAFDEFWPILESIEEIAAHTHPNAHGCFADKLLELCTATTDETVQAASGWLVNELHERTANERCLGGVVIERLRVAAPQATRIALGLVHKIKGDKLVAEVSVKGSRGSEAVDSEMTSYEGAVASANTKLSTSTARAFVEELAEKNLEDGKQLLGINGLTWMTVQRDVFHKRCESEAPDETFLQDLCAALMSCAEERRTCAFLVIEALEPIRDKFAAACVKAMCNAVEQSAGRFDQGVAVCVAEGFEEGAGGCGFPRWKDRWETPSSEKHKPLGTAAVGLFEKTKSIPRLAPIVGWMNLRLDLHESAERRLF